jgi:hypothetical protein
LGKISLRRCEGGEYSWECIPAAECKNMLMVYKGRDAPAMGRPCMYVRYLRWQEGLSKLKLFEDWYVKRSVLLSACIGIAGLVGLRDEKGKIFLAKKSN